MDAFSLLFFWSGVFKEVDFVNDFQGTCKKVEVYVVLVQRTANRSAFHVISYSDRQLVLLNPHEGHGYFQLSADP